MSNISTDFSTWSTTATSNQPDSGDTATVQSDLQRIQAAMRIIMPNVNAALTPTHTELNYVDGVTSAIQTQLNAKVGSTGATITSPTLVTPALGTPTSGTLTNCTGLPLTTGITGTLADDNGGTGQSTYATGDLLYASGSNTLAKRTIGTTGQVLTVTGGVPTWADSNTGTIFTSTGNAFAFGTAYSVSHGLSGTPDLWKIKLRCTTTDAGYAVGDVIEVPHHFDGGGGYGNTWVNATQMGVGYVTSITIKNKGSTAAVAITAANWVVDYFAIKF